MDSVTDEKIARMGEFHNQVTALIDQASLTPLEVATVLRLLTNNVERLFELSVKGGG